MALMSIFMCTSLREGESIMVDPLLTVNEVAELLRVDVRTIYDHQMKLGGFYPAGIRVFRFRRDVIEQIMQGPRSERFEALISAPKRVRGRPFVKGEPSRNGKMSRPGGRPGGRPRKPANDPFGLLPKKGEEAE